MTAAAYLEAVRAELDSIRPDDGGQSAAACAWRWRPDHQHVDPQVWHGYGVDVTWTPLSGWWVAGIRPNGTATGRQRLELATWAEPDWVASEIWDALTGDAYAGNGPRLLWDGLPGFDAPAELPYVGGPFAGRTVPWQRSEPAAVDLVAATHDGNPWPAGCYVLDHGAAQPRFLWLGPTALPVTGRARTHVAAWFPGDLLGSPDAMGWQLFDAEDWADGTHYVVLAEDLAPDCTHADLRFAVEDELGPVLEIRAGTYTVAPVAPTGEPGEWLTCPAYDIVADGPNGEDNL